jgi:hypothetical protein
MSNFQFLVSTFKARYGEHKNKRAFCYVQRPTWSKPIRLVPLMKAELGDVLFFRFWFQYENPKLKNMETLK